jgi:hypothetical protein
LNHWIGLARRAFAKEQVVQKIVQNEVLMFFAGLGLANIKNPTSDNPIWVAAQSSVVDEYIGDNFSAVFEQYFANRRKVLPSLNIILAEIIARISLNQPASKAEGRTRDEVMLWLAGTHFTQLVPDNRNDTLIWAPFDDLACYFGSAEWRASIRMPKPGQLTFLSPRKLVDPFGIRADCTLSATLNDIRESMGRDAAFGHLLAMETHGDAIAYRDFDGGLAWKAAREFRCDA